MQMRPLDSLALKVSSKWDILSFADSIRDLLPPLFSPRGVCLWGHTSGTSIQISSGVGVGEKIIMVSRFFDSLTTSLELGGYYCGIRLQTPAYQFLRLIDVALMATPEDLR